MLSSMSAPTAGTSGRNNASVRVPSTAPYVAQLDAAWQAHLAPRRPGAPTVVSLFAGAGGSSLGYSMAGYREALAVEWDDDAANTFRCNFPGVPLFHGDITKLSIHPALDIAGVGPGELDVLDGSPPCQGFSTAGKRQLDDERNRLFRHYIRFLEGFQPKVLVMENVSGMVKGKMKLLFADIMRALKESGYRVSARLLNAMYFGVPQSRERMIFIGVRADLHERESGGELWPSHPRGHTVPITFREACYDLRGNQPDDRMLKPVIRLIARHQPDRWTTRELIYRYFKGNTGSMHNLQWAGWERVCGTIVKSEIALAGIVHPDRERYISLAEAKRLTSFPDEFEFTDRKQGIARIGNSVPPFLMRSLAQHIQEHILSRSCRTLMVAGNPHGSHSSHGSE